MAGGPPHLERAAADGVGLVLVLLVARAQREHVDEVQRDRHLALVHAGAAPVALVGLADVRDVVLAAHKVGGFSVFSAMLF